MKSENRKSISYILLAALIYFGLSGCTIVDRIDSLNGIMEPSAPHYEIDELKKGEAAYFRENYEEAKRLFTAIITNSGNEIYQKYAFYGLVCIQMITAKNIEELKLAIDKMGDWDNPESRVAGFHENPRMIVKALIKQCHLLDLECVPEIKYVANKKTDKIVKKQKKEIYELKETIKKLENQISVLEAIDQEIEEKRKPI